MRARIRDTEIYFDVDGAALVPSGSRMQERPPAFVIHGGPGADHSGLKARCADLADRLQLVYFDHRGQGRSARGNRSKYLLEENVEDMEALRVYLGLGPIVSIGTSYGGMVAMAHAARFPDSVSQLILIATAAHSGFLTRAKEIVAQRGTVDQVSQYQALLDGRLDSAEKVRHYFEVMGPLYSMAHDPKQAALALDRGILSAEPLNEAFAPGGFLRNFDLRPQLAKIKAPTLILVGRHDWICPPEFSEEIYQLIRGSDLRIFEHSGHAMGADEREPFLDAIRGFVVYKTRCLS